MLVDSAKRATEDREAGLREQINAALQKIRAYARDMEESLEQERLKLEEVGNAVAFGWFVSFVGRLVYWYEPWVCYWLCCGLRSLIEALSSHLLVVCVQACLQVCVCVCVCVCVLYLLQTNTGR